MANTLRKKVETQNLPKISLKDEVEKNKEIKKTSKIKTKTKVD